MFKKQVYTSGVIVNEGISSNNLAQELWVSVANYGDCPARVKVEVFNWGNPEHSAGLDTGVVRPLTQCGILNCSRAVTVRPVNEVCIEPGKTQHFYANISEVESYEVRVTVLEGDKGCVLFNATTINSDVNPDRLASLIPFKDFTLLNCDKDDKHDKHDKCDKCDKCDRCDKCDKYGKCDYDKHDKHDKYDKYGKHGRYGRYGR
jgi:hypothetical protein